MELFTETGLAMLSRFGHVISGVTWIGLLYYFNFVQVPAFAGFEAAARTEAISKLVPRALWWFRWGAVATVATGLLLVGIQPESSDDYGAYFESPRGVAISFGMTLGIIMFLNVWGVIWRNQKVVIASAQGVLEGKPADPAAADAGRKALLASRTNALFSISLLFFMVFAPHLAPVYQPAEKTGMFMGPLFLIVLLLELNALGVIGGFGQGPTKKYLETHKNTIIAGFVLLTLSYVWFEVCFG